MNSDGNIEQEKVLREKGLAFFGAITASVSHELNNVISIIDQTAGLLGDLLYGAQNGRPIANERLMQIAESITRQTERGVGVIKRLNTFAHSVDYPGSEFEINQVVENLTELTQRFASLKKVQLKIHQSDEQIKIINSPFLIQQALFLCIRQLLSTAQKDSTITVSISEIDSGACLQVEKEGTQTAENAQETNYLETLMNQIGGTIETRSNAGNTLFELNIPRQRG